MLRERVISGAILLGIVAVIIVVRGPLLVAGVALAAAIGVWEFYGMARRGGYQPWTAGGIVLTLALVAEAALLHEGAGAAGEPGIAPLPASLIFTAVTLVFALILAARTDAPPAAVWASVGLTIAGALYVGGLLRYGLLLAHTPSPAGEAGWLLLILVGTAGSDTGAYFAGRTWGKRKLIPHISPGKTWMGLWGGMATAVIGVALVSPFLGIPWWHVVPLGLALNLASVTGDLAESMLKRGFGAKDSGTWIPGHGGLLDRLDSLLFVLVVVYGYSALFYPA